MLQYIRDRQSLAKTAEIWLPKIGTHFFFQLAHFLSKNWIDLAKFELIKKKLSKPSFLWMNLSVKFVEKSCFRHTVEQLQLHEWKPKFIHAFL